MTNYTFAYASAQAEAPDIAKNMGAAPFPRVNDNPAKPPLGGFNLAVSSYSGHKQEAFEAAACLAGEKSELTAVELDGLPPSHENLYSGKVVKKAYPGFAGLVKESIEAAGPRPTTAGLPGRHLGDPADPAPAGQDRPRRHRRHLRGTEVEPRSRGQAGRAALMEAGTKAPAAAARAPAPNANWPGCCARRRCIAMLAVTAYPIGYAIVLSLQKLDLRFPEQTEFVGLSQLRHGAQLANCGGRTSSTPC